MSDGKHTSEPGPTYTPLYDMATIDGSITTGEPLRISDEIVINGTTMPRRGYPEFDALHKRRDLFVRTLGRLPTAGAICPFCKRRLWVSEEEFDDPYKNETGWPELHAITRLEHCKRCGFWRYNELRTETSDVKAALYDPHALTTVISKLAEFDEVPEGVLSEISQWFRRHPNLYHSVNPTYLERLVCDIFKDAGQHSEVIHVGRPDDGGVDVLLVDNDESTRLVQVKRRESPDVSEPVETVRNLIGAMVLKGARLGAIVSTADHFTYRAQEAIDIAGRVGYKLDLIDRHMLDRMLAKSLPKSPWANIKTAIDSERNTWFDPENWTYDGRPPIFRHDIAVPDLTRANLPFESRPIPHQDPLF